MDGIYITKDSMINMNGCFNNYVIMLSVPITYMSWTFSYYILNTL